MNGKYKIELSDQVLKDIQKKISKSDSDIIKKAIISKLSTDPFRFGEPMKYNMKGFRRLRVGDYRVIYKIEETSDIVSIYEIGHRKSIYH